MGNMCTMCDSQAKYAEIEKIYDCSMLLQLIGATQPQDIIRHSVVKHADERHPIQAPQGKVLLVIDGCIDLYQNDVKTRLRVSPSEKNVTAIADPTQLTRYSLSKSVSLDDKGAIRADEILIYWKTPSELVCRYSCQTDGHEVILKCVVGNRITIHERTQYLSISTTKITGNSNMTSNLNALTNADFIELLAGIPFFANIPKAELEALTDLATIRVFPGNSVIFQEDESMSTQMFVTLAGSLEVSSTRATAPLAKLEPGSFFGEMSLLINIPRAATVTAIRNCMLMSIEKESFQALIDLSPDIKVNVHKLLKERLFVKAMLSGVFPFFQSVPLTRMIEFSHGFDIEDQIRKGDCVMDQASTDHRFAFLVYGALEITSNELKKGGKHRDHSVYLTPGCYFGPFTFERLGIQHGKVFARSPVVLLTCTFDKVHQLFSEYPEAGVVANISWFGERCDLASVLRHAVLTQRFQTFLAAEHSDENFDFCTDVEKFRTTQSNEDRHRLAHEIRQRYIQPDSPKEVNLPAAIHDSIIEMLDKLSSAEELPVTFFDDAKDEIMRLMTKDSFPRFKKSPLFQNILDTLDPHFNRRGSKLVEACHVFRDSLNVHRAGHVEPESAGRLNRMLSTIRRSQDRHKEEGAGSSFIPDRSKVQAEG